MAFLRACALDDVWEGDMALMSVAGQEVLVVHLDGGGVRAFDPRCPHQGWSLAEGSLDDGVLVCGMHGWEFDVRSGAGVNPTDCALRGYAVEIRDGEVWVDINRAPPLAAEQESGKL
jgi:toluene monooxygenase system ferredoxin subunit